MKWERVAATMLCILANSAQADTPLTVRVENVQSGNGQVIVCLWRDGDGYPDCNGTEPSARKSAPATSPTIVTFEGIAAGKYAISTIHDRNGDGLLKTNVLGIPQEPVGFSNNAVMRFGPPTFGNAAFNWTPGVEITIKLN